MQNLTRSHLCLLVDIGGASWYKNIAYIWYCKICGKMNLKAWGNNELIIHVTPFKLLTFLCVAMAPASWDSFIQHSSHHRSSLINKCPHPFPLSHFRRSANGDPCLLSLRAHQGFSILASTPALVVQASAQQDRRAAASEARIRPDMLKGTLLLLSNLSLSPALTLCGVYILN